MKKWSLLFITVLCISQAQAQLGPTVTSWMINTTGATGYAGILSNVQQVQYSDSNVYVSATCIPGYSIGPWAGNPNVAENQDFVYKITRFPVYNTGTPTAVALGHVGVFTNGVSVFNTQDAHSYNNLGYWNQNAYFFEGSGFDNCLGHPDQTGEYHHHVSPKCLYDIYDSTHHSPIIGYAFDGFPIYGAYGYADTNGTGGIKRIRSSYQVRSITTRDTLPNGTILSPADYGPAISSTYPLGAYQEDFIYVAGSGNLDASNGRWCVTPDYPNGTYAYFVTLDSALLPAYPYTLGSVYYGVVHPGNTGPGSGHNTITDSVQTYTTGVAQVSTSNFSTMIFPNPANQVVHLYIQPIASNNFTVTIVDVAGNALLTQKDIQPTIMYDFDVSRFAPGIYSINIKNTGISYSQKIVVAR